MIDNPYKVDPTWKKLIPKGEFISYKPSYTAGVYFDLFDRNTFENDEVGTLIYYVFDPVKHGGNSEQKYPTMFFFHGRGNSLEGEYAVNYSMAELFASPDYQKEFGGAYAISILANECRDENGDIHGDWSKPYAEPVMRLIRSFRKEHENNVGKNVIFGTSKGGFMTWLLLERFSREIDIAVPIAAPNIVSDEKLDEIRENGTRLLVMHGVHDEVISFEKYARPRIPKLMSMDNVECYFPEWVRNGDGGIAHLYFGAEMGQHCLNNQVSSNLIFDDGTPYDDMFSEGVTGWLRDRL